MWRPRPLCTSRRVATRMKRPSRTGIYKRLHDPCGGRRRAVGTSPSAFWEYKGQDAGAAFGATFSPTRAEVDGPTMGSASGRMRAPTPAAASTRRRPIHRWHGDLIQGPLGVPRPAAPYGREQADPWLSTSTPLTTPTSRTTLRIRASTRRLGHRRRYCRLKSLPALPFHPNKAKVGGSSASAPTSESPDQRPVPVVSLDHMRE